MSTKHTTFILKLIGLSIIIFQLYKYFTNQLFESNFEGILFIIGLLLVTSPQRLTRILANKLSTKTYKKNE